MGLDTSLSHSNLLLMRKCPCRLDQGHNLPQEIILGLHLLGQALEKREDQKVNSGDQRHGLRGQIGLTKKSFLASMVCSISLITSSSSFSSSKTKNSPSSSKAPTRICSLATARGGTPSGSSSIMTTSGPGVGNALVDLRGGST